MQQNDMRDVLVRADAEEADAVPRTPGVDPLVWRAEPPIPLPPIPPQ